MIEPSFFSHIPRNAVLEQLEFQQGGETFNEGSFFPHGSGELC